MVLAQRAVRHAVDHAAAHAADAFAAIVVEGDRLFALGDQVLVQHVEHFEERHVSADVRRLRSGPCGPRRAAFFCRQM